jgi:hypothetical protein
MPHTLPLTLMPLSVGDAMKPPDSLVCCCTLTTVQKARDLSGGAAALRNAPLRGAARASSHWPMVLLFLPVYAGHINVSEICTACVMWGSGAVILMCSLGSELPCAQHACLASQNK